MRAMILDAIRRACGTPPLAEGLSALETRSAGQQDRLEAILTSLAALEARSVGQQDRLEAIVAGLGALEARSAGQQDRLEAIATGLTEAQARSAVQAAAESRRLESLPTHLAALQANAAAQSATGADLLARMDAVASRNDDARQTILDWLSTINHNLTMQAREAERRRELYYRDMLLALDRVAHILPQAQMRFEAETPVAVDTDDHLFPWGAAHDNTRSPRFVAACERILGSSLTAMDMGCSGGGLVLDFILRGHRAFGVEGSDHPRREQRAEWRMLRNNLFTADITRPFALCEGDGGRVQCDVISAWEVMEHIGEDDLPQLFANVRAHLRPGGLFVGSVALVPDDHPETGAHYHRTVQPRGWWEERFAAAGLPMLASHGFEPGDFCRGVGNGPMDGDYVKAPELGFHFVAGNA